MIWRLSNLKKQVVLETSNFSLFDYIFFKPKSPRQPFQILSGRFLYDPTLICVIWCFVLPELFFRTFFSWRRRIPASYLFCRHMFIGNYVRKLRYIARNAFNEAFFFVNNNYISQAYLVLCEGGGFVSYNYCSNGLRVIFFVVEYTTLPCCVALIILFEYSGKI